MILGVFQSLVPQSLGFSPSFRCTRSLPHKCNFCSRCLMFVGVSLGCVSRGCLHSLEGGQAPVEGGGRLPAQGWGCRPGWGPCCHVLAEVRICSVGEVCTKHEGVCLHILSALNKICLSLEFKAFYERKSSLMPLNNLAEVDAVMLIFAACFSGVLSLFNTYQFLEIFSHWAFCSSCTSVTINFLCPSSS